MLAPERVGSNLSSFFFAKHAAEMGCTHQSGSRISQRTRARRGVALMRALHLPTKRSGDVPFPTSLKFNSRHIYVQRCHAPRDPPKKKAPPTHKPAASPPLEDPKTRLNG